MNSLFGDLKHALAGQAPGDFLAWGAMLLPFILMIVIMRKQHRRLAPLLSEPSEELQHTLFEMARGRGWVLCFLWAALTLTIISYGLKFPTRYQDGGEAEKSQIAPAAVTASAADVVSGSPEAAAVLAQVPAMAREALIDRIQAFYEDAFISYYYLNKCGVAKKDDNETLYRAMLAELAPQKAEEAAKKVIDAAQGSFEVIYSQSPCDESYLTPVQRDFGIMMQTLPSRLGKR